MKILIVDDSKAMRHIVARGLRDIGLGGETFVEASDGEEALRVVHEQHPDLIISDFNMPGMSGLEFLRTLRHEGNTTVFGFVTSEAQDQMRIDAAEAGSRFVITKPFTAANMSASLGPVLAELGRRAFAVDDDASSAFKPGNGIPKAVQLAAFLRGLLRRPVSAVAVPAIPLPPRGPAVVAQYHKGGEPAVVACVVCDLPFAAQVGAALSLIPPSAAVEAVTAKQLPGTLGDNFREVMNVMSQMFESEKIPSVRLSQILKPGEKIAPELAIRIMRPATRLDTSVEISGYGKGTLTLVSLA